MPICYKKNVIKIFSICLCIAMAVTCILALLNPALSDDFTSFVNKADEGVNKVSDGVYKIAMTAGPLALLVCLVVILFSHDSRKVSLIVGICITIILAWLAIMVVHSGWVKEFLSGIASNYFPGQAGD